MAEEKTLEQKEERLQNMIRVTIMEDYDLRPSVAKEIAGKAMDLIRKNAKKEA
jgi:hypothetical protein